jgi:hypothetical protein
MHFTILFLYANNMSDLIAAEEIKLMVINTEDEKKHTGENWVERLLAFFPHIFNKDPVDDAPLTNNQDHDCESCKAPLMELPLPYQYEMRGGEDDL